MSVSDRTFSYAEALASLPAVSRLTRAAVGQVEALFNRVQSWEEMERRRTELEEALAEIVAAWEQQIEAIGCTAKGPWLVDWDSGDGFFCWRYPEETIAHFHSYEEGFDGRVPIN